MVQHSASRQHGRLDFRGRASGARRRPFSSGLEAASRVGYAARGFVYFSIGVMALLAAFGRAPSAEGADGALQAWARLPFGTALLWLTAVGLFGFAAWRALQSFFDADGQGTNAKAMASRIGQAISGVVYGALGWSALRLAQALGERSGAGSSGDASEGIGKALSLPGGLWLVMIAGLFIVGCGVGNLVQAFKRDFNERLATPAEVRKRVQRLGQIGYAGRGVVFLPAGVFVFLAGRHARPQEAKGTGEALDWLGSLPFGDWLLTGAAVGLIAFGLFAFVEARYRSLDVWKAVSR